MSRETAFLVLVAMCAFFVVAGLLQLRLGLRTLRHGEAWNRLQMRPMTPKERWAAVAVLLVTGILGLVSAIVVGWVLIVAY